VVVVAEEEAGIDGGGGAGVNGGRGDREVESAWWSREWWGLREFGMKIETTRAGLLFIGSKILTSVLN
jgi:hypothetical protein